MVDPTLFDHFVVVNYDVIFLQVSFQVNTPYCTVCFAPGLLLTLELLSLIKTRRDLLLKLSLRSHLPVPHLALLRLRFPMQSRNFFNNVENDSDKDEELEGNNNEDNDEESDSEVETT